MAEERRPFHGKCAECGHIWVVLYLPMEVLRAAKTMQWATCPMCGGRKIFIPSGEEVNAHG